MFLSPRPFLAWPDINLIFESGGFDSFPSGHATFLWRLGAALFAYHRIGGVFYVVAALAIGVARIISGIHWPLDVLAGWLWADLSDTTRTSCIICILRIDFAVALSLTDVRRPLKVVFTRYITPDVNPIDTAYAIRYTP